MTAGAAALEAPGQPVAPVRWQLGIALLANAVLAVAAAALPLRRLLDAYQANDWWSYQASEWLINNGGGVVRRGLAGDMLLSVPGVEGRTAVTVFVGVLMVAVPAAYAWLIASVIGRAGAVWPVLLWAVPGGVFLGLWQGQWLDLSPDLLLFATRKEHAFLLLLIIFALLVTSTSDTRMMHRWALAYGLVLLVLAWVHEGLTFVYAVAGAMLVWLAVGVVTQGSWRIRAGGALAVLIPAGVGVVSTLPFAEPSDAQLQQMWAAVDEPTRGWLGDRLPAAFELMGYSISEARAYAEQSLEGRGLMWAVLAVYVIGWTCAALILTDTSRAGVQVTLVSAAVVSLAVLPLLLVAIDWGRFMVISASATAVVVLARQRLGPPTARPAPLSLTTALIAVVMLALLASVGVPEAGAPFGE